MPTSSMNFVLYQNGLFQQVEDFYAPAMLRNIVQNAITEDDDASPDLDDAVTAAGGSLIEGYGCNDELIFVYKVETFWLVEHVVCGETSARIYINTLADYLNFQAKWIAPMAHKVMAKIGLTMAQEIRAVREPDPQTRH